LVLLLSWLRLYLVFYLLLASCAQLQSKTFYLTFVADCHPFYLCAANPFYLTEGEIEGEIEGEEASMR
jgi:hypothetical protein